MDTINLPHRHGRETRNLLTLPEVKTRDTALRVQMTELEIEVFSRLTEHANSLQQQANHLGIQQYFQYFYDPIQPLNGHFVALTFVQEDGMYSLVRDSQPKTGFVKGPIGCVYPSEFQVIYTHEPIDESNYVRNAYGIQTRGMLGNPIRLETDTEIELKALLYEDAPEGAVLDEPISNYFLHQLRENRNGQVIRPFAFSKRDNFSTIVLPSLFTSSHIANFSITALSKAVQNSTSMGDISDLDPVNVMKYSLLTLGTVLELTILDCDGKSCSQLSLKHPKCTKSGPVVKEEAIKTYVIDALKGLQIPRNSIVLGGLFELIRSIAATYSLKGSGFHMGVPELEQLLNAIQSYGLEFSGPTIPFMELMTSKTMPAVCAHLAGSPYPGTYRVQKELNRQPTLETFNPGGLLHTTLGYVVKAAYTSQSNGVSFLNTDLDTLVASLSDGTWSVSERTEIHGTERRYYYHPKLGFLMVADRDIPEDVRNSTDIEAIRKGCTLRGVQIDDAKIAAAKTFIESYTRWILQMSLLLSGVKPEHIPLYEQAFLNAGIIPSLGMVAFDVLVAKQCIGNFDDISLAMGLPQGTPFISEIQTSVEVPIELRYGETLMNIYLKPYLKSKRALVLPGFATGLHLGRYILQKFARADPEIMNVLVPTEFGLEGKRYTSLDILKRRGSSSDVIQHLKFISGC